MTNFEIAIEIDLVCCDQQERSVSVMGTIAFVKHTGPADPILFDLPRRNLRAGFTVLDGVSLPEIFARLVVVMRSIPKCFQGAHVTAVRVSIHEILDGKASGNMQQEVCGWKLFFLLPSRGEVWCRSCMSAWRCSTLAIGPNFFLKATAMQRPELKQQCGSVVNMFRTTFLGEQRGPSGWRCIARGNLSTLRDLTNPIRRPAAPREPLHEDLTRYVPEHDFQLDPDVFLANVRSPRRGVAAGPSGMTADHLRPLLESERDSEVLAELGASLARGEGPEVVWEAIRMGWMTALRKADGGVRGIVVGDRFRRLVSHTIAQQIAKSVEAATSPFQYALSTKAGTECVSHMLQTLIGMDEKLTILSVDGIGAFDHVSRNSMLRGLMETDVPLMPLLFCLSLHRALVAANAIAGGRVSFLHSLTMCTPHVLQTECWLCIGSCSKRFRPIVAWNHGGEHPVGCEALTRAAQTVDPNAMVWRGDTQLAPQQGIVVLGSPVRHEAFIMAQLSAKREEHQVLLDRIPCVSDVQTALHGCCCCSVVPQGPIVGFEQ